LENSGGDNRSSMKYRVLIHEQVKPGYYYLRLKAPEIARTAQPGQFVMIKVTTLHQDPLLRRPISIMDANPLTGEIELLFKVVGRGTQLLSDRPAGCDLDVLGPLGNGFKTDTGHHNAVLVGGGIGIPPMVFLAHILASRLKVETHAFLGVRSADDCIGEEKFKQYGAFINWATETGERGEKGLVTKPLKTYLNTVSPADTIIYACGPKPMLKAVAELGFKRNILVFVSLEEHMGCGVGACLGCVIETRTGPARICKDGPVFDARMLGNAL
jgi:dihydroorotate dehydrogenase electron transfer subunit